MQVELNEADLIYVCTALKMLADDAILPEAQRKPYADTLERVHQAHRAALEREYRDEHMRRHIRERPR